MDLGVADGEPGTRDAEIRARGNRETQDVAVEPQRAGEVADGERDVIDAPGDHTDPLGQVGAEAQRPSTRPTPAARRQGVGLRVLSFAFWGFIVLSSALLFPVALLLWL